MKCVRTCSKSYLHSPEGRNWALSAFKVDEVKKSLNERVGIIDLKKIHGTLQKHSCYLPGDKKRLTFKKNNYLRFGGFQR